MNWEAIGVIAEVVGATATVGTLIYVAVQIRENTSWSKRQVLEAVIDRLNSWQARMNENPEMLEIYLEGKEAYQSFEQTEKYRYNFIMAEFLGMFD